VKIFPVVMAGGSGTRFWPLSRARRPKQFLPLTGGAPLLAETVARLPPLARIGRTLVVCGRAHVAAVRRILPRLPAENLLVEPCARNTAPCVGLAALHVARRDPRGVLAMLPADHHVARPDAFRDALAAGATLAEGGRIATVGIRPSRPETGYGYLKVGAALPSPAAGAEAFLVERFVEKPDRETAGRYLEQGGYLWNAGIFLFRADVILAEIRAAMPGLADRLDAIGAAIGTRRYASVLAREFPACPSESIDYGVMERSANIAVVPADFGWSDVGSFDAVAEVRHADADGNVVDGEAFVIEGRRNVVLGGDRPIALVGVEGLVVVDAGDAILVCPRDRAQDVKKMVDLLRARGRDDLL
jgi:mannose-1-phosphate guanylyltransferase